MRERFIDTIKSFDASTGNGFIERQGGPDVFFHISAFRSKSFQPIRPGQAVEFSIERDAKHPKAIDIVIMK